MTSPRRAPGVLIAFFLLLAVTAACGDSSAGDSPTTPGSTLLTADQVGGEQTGSGTELLEPAAPPCDAEGPFLWGDASDDDVRGFQREVDGHTEDIVVGAWPMPEEAANTALRNMSTVCAGGRWTVQPFSIGLGSGSDGTARSFEVRERDGNAEGDLVSWSVRAYTYAEGHLITVWSERPDSRPSGDGIHELVLQQEEALAAESRGS